MWSAARVSLDVYRAVLPMLALTGGRMVCLSTPFGERGFFYEAWVKGGSDWERIEVLGERAVPSPSYLVSRPFWPSSLPLFANP
jgi:hypothetical protein